MKRKPYNGYRCCFFHLGIAAGLLIFARFPSALYGQDANSGEASTGIVSSIEAANGTELIPEQIRRPSRGEDPRYPRDTVIGELGRGQASEGAYGYARELFSALVRKDFDAAAVKSVSAGLRDEIGGIVEAINAQRYRIGGGREEEDGSTSFLFRFIGRERGAAGELYIRQEEEAWQVDDIIIEEPQDISVKRDAYPYDFTPYERFF
jgi:hypothetical protein